ncbi:MAG: glycosyltransferase [Syntrophobacteraceae bacterium]
MNYILYSETADHNLTQKLGCAEYSYFFVRESFRKLLEPKARTFIVTDPEKKVDAIFDNCKKNGEECVFLSFAPPHRSFLSLRCPTIPIFAWEFDTIPSEEWNCDPRNDWRRVLAQFGCAITHSAFSAMVIRDAMHPDFPVTSIPAPIWDGVRLTADAFVYNSAVELPVRLFLDTRLSHTLVAPAKPKRSLSHRLRRTLKSVSRHEEPMETIRFSRDEVIYMSVFNPWDGRKNWPDMLSAFVIALAKCPNATLVLKLVHFNSRSALDEIRVMLARFPLFQCRVVVIGDFLDESDYQQLIALSKFVVNTSLGEGQCLPLMEGMSWGKPALAPQHTSMSEYVDESTGFIIKTSIEPCSWPHDQRAAVRAYRHRVNWQSVACAFSESFTMLRTDPQSYERMSLQAVESQRAFCSEESAMKKLQEVVNLALAEQDRRTNFAPEPAFAPQDREPCWSAQSFPVKH